MQDALQPVGTEHTASQQEEKHNQKLLLPPQAHQDCVQREEK